MNSISNKGREVFGPGIAIRELGRLAPEGYVCGIDHSELMLRRARRLNAGSLGRSDGPLCGILQADFGG